MTPLHVSARNYGPYPTVDWEIPAGLSAIIGRNTIGDGADSNGSGKTKLLELVPICLFGPPLPWSEYLTVGAEETTVTVTLVFEHGGERYRVRRSYDAKGRGKTLLDLEIAHTDLGPNETESWTPLTRNTQAETQTLINETIGLSEATFAHSVFAAQGAPHFADPNLPPRERKVILTQALNLGIWDDLAKLCRADIAAIETEIAAIDRRVGDAARDLDQIPAVKAEREQAAANAALITADLAACESTEAAARDRHTQTKDAAERHAAAVRAVDSALTVLAMLDATTNEAAQASAQIEEALTLIATLEPVAAQAPALLAQINTLTVADSTGEQARREQHGLLTQAVREEAQAAEAATLVDQYRSRSAEIAAAIERMLDGEPGSCDHCGQPLAGDALDKAIASLRRDADALDQHALNTGRDIEAKRNLAADYRAQAAMIQVPKPAIVDRADLQRRAAEAQNAERTLISTRVRIEQLQPVAAKATSAEFHQQRRDALERSAEAQAVIDTMPPIDPMQVAAAARDLERAALDIVTTRATDRQLQTHLATLDERLRTLTALAARAQDALAEKKGHQDRLDTLNALARAYGRDGIPALIIEASAIPHIENEAQRVLDQLGMPFRVELVTQRENKGGGLKDTLDVVVHEPNGPRRYETYSGGERTRLEFALRIALARLIAHQSSSHVGMLALDEPAFLDATGMAQVAAVLRDLPEFRSIILVSHDERLVEAFDQTVTVIRDENGSRLGAAA